MPNHVTNELRVEATEDQFLQVKVYLTRNSTDEEGREYTKLVDFRKIRPYSPELDITSGSNSYDIPLKYLKEPDEIDKLMEGMRLKADDKIARCKKEYENSATKEVQTRALSYIDNYLQSIRNYIVYGYSTWYEWCNENWGTKWSAYDIEPWNDTEKTIIFKTAWCGVLDLMLEVSRNFPECTFCYRYASEDTGSCTGEYELKNGVATLTNEPENGTKKRMSWHLNLLEQVVEYYELVNGEYVCKDDDGDSKQGYIYEVEGKDIKLL